MEFLEVIEQNKDKFIRYNTKKLQKFQELIIPNLKKTINMVPFLLCVNHHKLPGYVAGDVPLGIWGYSVSDDTRRHIRGKFPTAKLDMQNSNPFVEMLAVMGSVGTVAYNKKSDFDYWVCVNKHHVTPQQYKKFTEKVEAIQKWVMSEEDVSVHLFINDVESLKHNIFAEDEEEKFGSTVGAVLKDEFLRSSTIIAGKIPFWWVIPKFVRDTDYNDLYERLPEDKKNEFIDLGNLYEVSRNDFLGAAYFQMNKSLDNPFKSIIKIGVLEKYIFGASDAPLLSQKLKTNIQRENFDDSVIDSYLFMFNEVYDYYSSTLNDDDLINILKQNLYLKVDPQISKYKSLDSKKKNISLPYKVAVMRQYIKEWGWDANTVKDLDQFDEWDYTKVKSFWDSVIKFMLVVYQKISKQLPSLIHEKKISETDHMLLTNKMKAYFLTYFKSEPDKIDHYISFKDTPSESILYIEPLSQGIDETGWRLCKRNKTKIKDENNLLRLIIWMTFNQIYNPVFSRLNIQSGYTRVNQNLVTDLLGQTAGIFSGDRMKVKNEYFLNPPFNLLNMVIINFNRENLEKISTIHHLYYTSYGESYLREYKSEEDIARILQIIIIDGLKLRRSYDDYFAVNTPEPFKRLYKRIIGLFKEAYNFFIENNRDVDARFVTQLGEKFILISKEDNDISINLYPNYGKLLSALSFKPRVTMRYNFYNDEGPLVGLGKVYSAYKQHYISVVYEEKSDYIIVYVINENGNLFVYLKNRKISDLTLIMMHDFCKNAIKHVLEKDKFFPVDQSQIKYYSLRTDRSGKNILVEETQSIENQYLAHYQNYYAVSAKVSKYIGQETFYDIQFPDNISSGFLTINDVYCVQDKLRELRVKGFATQGLFRDIVISDLGKDDYKYGTTPFFLEKYKLEFAIDQ